MSLLCVYLASSEKTDLSFLGKTMDIPVWCWRKLNERLKKTGSTCHPGGTLVFKSDFHLFVIGDKPIFMVRGNKFS